MTGKNRSTSDSIGFNRISFYGLYSPFLFMYLNAMHRGFSDIHVWIYSSWVWHTTLFFFLALTFSHDLSFYGLKFGWALQLHVKNFFFLFLLAFFKRKDDTPKHIKMDPFYTMNYVKIYFVLVR